MYYQEYAKAAFRHLSSCDRLLADIDSARKPNSEELHWVNEVYYLSGYVIECLLSYVLFYNYKDHVQNSDLYCDKFLVHNLQSKTHHVLVTAKRPLSGIPLISGTSSKKHLNCLFSDWSVDWRYEPNRSVNLPELREYIDVIKNIRKKIMHQYPYTK